MSEDKTVSKTWSGKIYQYGILDFLVRLVEGICRDFREVDDIYQELDGKARQLLRKGVLKSDMWEDAEERARLYDRVLSFSDLTPVDPPPAGFPTLSRYLREAATEWGKRKEHSAKEAYLAEIGNRARALREYLEQKSQGKAASLADATETLEPIFKVTVELLSNATLIGAFSGGGNGPSKKDWPYSGDDGGGHRLVVAIANRLAGRNLLDAESMRLVQGGNVSSVLQMAHLGAKVIALVMDDGWESKLEEIANLAFQWDRSYGDLSRQGGTRDVARPVVRPRAVA